MRYTLLYLLLGLVFSISHTSSCQTQNGFATMRHLVHEGLMTKSKEIFSHDSLVASHRNIAFGRFVKVTNLDNGKSVVVKINDRGPYIHGNIIDLSERAALSIGIANHQKANVHLKLLSKTFKPVADTPISPSSSSEDIVEKQLYSIQVASYTDKNNAVNYCEMLKKDLKIEEEIAIKSELIMDQMLHKVLIGAFNTRTEAEDFIKKLPSAIEKKFITSLNH